MTARQAFIFNLRKGGYTLDRIGEEYQKKYGTKRKPSRSEIRNILSSFGLWPPPEV